MRVKTFTSAGHSLEAAMEGLEAKLNEWMAESHPKTLDLKYSVVECSDRPHATAVVVYDN